MIRNKQIRSLRPKSYLSQHGFGLISQQPLWILRSMSSHIIRMSILIITASLIYSTWTLFELFHGNLVTPSLTHTRRPFRQAQHELPLYVVIPVSFSSATTTCHEIKKPTTTTTASLPWCSRRGSYVQDRQDLTISPQRVIITETNGSRTLPSPTRS